MPKIGYKQVSKTNWYGIFDTDWPGVEYVNMGSLQRIADATELMAKNYIELQRKCQYLELDNDNLRERYRATERRISALKGVITKLRANK